MKNVMTPQYFINNNSNIILMKPTFTLKKSNKKKKMLKKKSHLQTQHTNTKLTFQAKYSQKEVC